MNVLFLSMAGIGSLDSQNIYGDLLKTFVAHGHSVYVVNPAEKRTGNPTRVYESHGITVLDVKTGNLQKCGLVEKGISQIALEGQFLRAILRYFSSVSFDLILFPTPPTTLGGLVKKLKVKNNAKSYLLLKDIFPQNSLDLGMLSRHGVKGFIYRYFKHTEQKTYEASDFIGCMSEANREYLLMHEPWLSPGVVEVNPNSVIPYSVPTVDKHALRGRFGLPIDTKVFVYGGNLGKPQAIDFLVRALRSNEARGNLFFAVAGGGTERPLLERFFEEESPRFAKLFPFLSREDFDSLLWACDCGIVLLDHRFTIPNFPSRSLSYMQAGLPYVAATDSSSDIGTLAESEGFGLQTNSIDEERFLEICEGISLGRLKKMGEVGRLFLESEYTSERSYNLIMERMND